MRIATHMGDMRVNVCDFPPSRLIGREIIGIQSHVDRDVEVEVNARDLIRAIKLAAGIEEKV